MSKHHHHERKLDIEDFYAQFHNLDKHHDSMDAQFPELDGDPHKLAEKRKPFTIKDIRDGLHGKKKHGKQ